MSQEQRRVFWPALVVVLAISGALAFVVARTKSGAERRASFASTPASEGVNVTQGQTVRTGNVLRNMSLQPAAFNAARRLGLRFAPGGREHSVLVGTLTVGAERRVVVINRRQTDHGEQVEINVAGSPGLFTWDAATGALASGALATGSDRELIERLVFDSPDQFVLAQLRGASYYTIARNVRPANADDGYAGPLWDIVRVDDPQRDAEKKPESTWRLYYVDAKRGLIDKIDSELRGEKIEATISGWIEQNGEQVPGQITWTRQGQTLMQYQLTNFSKVQP